MTTREEYAEAAQHLRDCGTDDDGVDELFMLAAKLCQQVADGAVLCTQPSEPYFCTHCGKHQAVCPGGC